MKIIRVDNFNRDGYSDDLIASNIVCPNLGKIMLDALNSDASDSNPEFYRLVEDDYKLYVSEY